MSDRSDRVVVVGAGPVGLTSALALARRGIPFVLLAAAAELVMELRGSTFHPPTLDLLDEFGLVARMIEVGLKAPTWQFRDRETGPVATFDLSLLAGDTNHPYRVQCEQWKLMRCLEEELRKLPGSDIRFGHQVTSVRQDEDTATVTADTPCGPVSIAGRHVIAADGARSAVRTSLGVEFEGFTYPELFLIASTDFRFEDTLTDIAYVNYIADPFEWLVLLRVPDLWRVLVPAPESFRPGGAAVGRCIAAGAPPRGCAAGALPDCPSLPLPCASAGGEALPAWPRLACRRRRSHQQSARRHGDERRNPGRLQRVRQARADLGGSR